MYNGHEKTGQYYIYWSVHHVCIYEYILIKIIVICRYKLSVSSHLPGYSSYVYMFRYGKEGVCMTSCRRYIIGKKYISHLFKNYNIVISYRDTALTNIH